MATVYNTNSNTLLSGTSGKDSIQNGGWDENKQFRYGGTNVTISGGEDKDTIRNWEGHYVKISGDADNDYLYSYVGHGATISGGNGNDTIDNDWGDNVAILGGEGNDSIVSSGNNVTISGGEGDDYIHHFTDEGYGATITGGIGNDSIYNHWADDVEILGNTGNDFILNTCSNGVVISCGSGNDIISIDGGSSKFSENVTVAGDAGNDIIYITGYTKNTFIRYSKSDDNDIVYGFNSDDTLQITSGSYSTTKSGSDLIVQVGSGSLRLINAADEIVHILGTKDTSGGSLEKNSWKISGTTATYGTSKKTLATVKGAKAVKGFSTSGKKITLKNSALSKKVTVSGSYEFDFASGYKNATISGTSKADTITARGSNLKIYGGKGKDSIKMFGTEQTVNGGDGADSFIYTASGGKEKITDFSAKDTLKIGEYGDGNYSTVTSDSDVIVSTDDGGKITLTGAAGKSLNIVGTKETSSAGVKVKGKKITLTADYTDSSFSLSGKYSSAVTLNASAVTHDLKLVGNKEANLITGSSQNDTINGGAGADIIKGGKGSDSIFGGKGDDELHGGIGNDTLWGGAGNDELYGDAGNDTFYYKTGEGNDTIFGYEAGIDKIILNKGSVDNVASDDDNNVIFKIGTGQIVVNNGKDRTIQIVDSSGNQVKNGLWTR